MNKKFWAFALCAVVSVAFYGVLRFQLNAPEIAVVTYGTLEEHFYTEARVFYDQRVINSPINGRLVRIAEEGQRVSKGDVIARIDGSEANVYMEKLKDIDDQISKIKEAGNGIFSRDIASINKMIDEDMKKLQEAVNRGDSASVEKYRQDIKKLNDERKRIAKVSGFNVDEIISLLKQRKEILSKLSKNSIQLMAPQPGLLHYISNKQAVSAGQVVVSLIDNYQWYIQFHTGVGDLKQGQLVDIEFSDYSVPVKFYVSSVKKTNSGYDVVLSTTYYVKDFYKKRNEKVKVVLKNVEGLKIPRSALSKKGDITGVYVLKEKPVFYPVKVVSAYGKYAIVENENAGGGIKVYDEIIIDRRGEGGGRKD